MYVCMYVSVDTTGRAKHIEVYAYHLHNQSGHVRADLSTLLLKAEGRK